MKGSGFVTAKLLESLRTEPEDKRLSELHKAIDLSGLGMSRDFRGYSVASDEGKKSFAFLVALYLLDRQDSASRPETEASVSLFWVTQCAQDRYTFIDGGVFPIDGGYRSFYFRDLPFSLLKDFLTTGELPGEALAPALSRIGIGEKYHKVDPERFRQKDYLRSYMQALLDGDKRGFILLGNRGVGKTSVMAYLARLILTQPKLRAKESDIAFFNSDRLFTAINSSYIRADQSGADILRKTRFVIIDDLGQIFDQRSFRTVFEGIMSSRYDRLMTTFLTTNMSAQMLRDHQYFGRLADRCNDPDWMHAPLIIDGTSMRKPDIEGE